MLQRSGYYYWQNASNIWLYDTQTKTSADLTRLSANHGVPRFTSDGRYLLMLSDRDGVGIYAIPLRQEDSSPGDIEMKFEKPTAPVKVVVVIWKGSRIVLGESFHRSRMEIFASTRPTATSISTAPATFGSPNMTARSPRRSRPGVRSPRSLSATIRTSCSW